MVRRLKVKEQRDRLTRRRMGAFVAIFAICLAVILSRLVDLQVVRHDQLLDQAERQHLLALKVKPDRGRLLDRRGRALALSIPASSIYAHTAILATQKYAASLLGSALGLPTASIAARLRQKRSFVWLKRQVTPREVQRVRKLKLPGIGVLPENRRFYPKRSLAGQALGFVGIDGTGLEGMELHFDRYLRGLQRTITVTRDAAGRKLRLLDTTEPAPARGYDVVLTLDEAIQTMAEQALHEQVVRSKARAGVVIVLDPNDGALLALAQEPAFNPNTYGQAQPGAWRNRAIADSYEPGSTFKVIAASAALDLQRIRMTELFFGELGRYTVGGIVIHDEKPFRWLTVAQVIQKSSNIGAVKIAQRLTRREFYRAIRRFGFGKPSGIDLAGEAAGLLRPVADWSQSSIGALAIGQELAVTPLQLALAYAAIANGGELLRPHVLHQVRRGPEVTLAAGRQVVRRVISEKTSAIMRRILRGVIEDGTGKLAAVPGYDVAGKTGTAQKADASLGAYAPGKYVASFVGFAPAENARIVVLVLLDEPQGVHYGGKVAAPVFRRVVTEVLYYLRVPSRLMTRKTIPQPGIRPGIGIRAAAQRAQAHADMPPWLNVAATTRRLLAQLARLARGWVGAATGNAAAAVAGQAQLSATNR